MLPTTFPQRILPPYYHPYSHKADVIEQQGYWNERGYNIVFWKWSGTVDWVRAAIKDSVDENTVALWRIKYKFQKSE